MQGVRAAARAGGSRPGRGLRHSHGGFGRADEAAPAHSKPLFTAFVPTLEVWLGPAEGRPSLTLQHSRVVMHYLSHSLGYSGATAEEAHVIDMLTEECEHMWVRLAVVCAHTG